jgi:hypothetical protein
VEYPRLDGEGPYDDFVKPIVKDISPGLKGCASDGFYYTATDTPDIQATLNKMAKNVIEGQLVFTR